MALKDDDPVEVYRQEIAAVLPLTEEERDCLLQEARQLGERGEFAKKRLIESHLHLVLPVAERYASGPLSMLELIQEGNCGLMRALDKFPEARLDNFVAYGTSYIEGFISDAIARSKITPGGIGWR